MGEADRYYIALRTGSLPKALELKEGSVDNIQIFRALSGLVYAKAYEKFPLKITLCPSELALELEDKFWVESQRELSDNEFEYVRHKSPAGLARATVEWLVGAGFISCDQCKDGNFVGVTLTAKGLESIEADQSRGQKLRSALGDLAKDELKDQARKQLSNAFSSALSWSIANVPTIMAGLSKVGAS